MRHLSSSVEVRQKHSAGQAGNGKFLHGRNGGSAIHIRSLNKRTELEDKNSQENEKNPRKKAWLHHGSSPSWSIKVHKEPSFTDESPLMTSNYFASCKLEQIHGARPSKSAPLSSKKCGKPLRYSGVMYYRPNQMHQYLSATDLKNHAQAEVNVQLGRPTRTTLLKARQMREATGSVLYQTRKEFLHRLDKIRNSRQSSPRTGYLNLDKLLDGSTVHTFLTGARYNRYNSELGCCFTGSRHFKEHLQKCDNPVEPDLPKPDLPKPRPWTASRVLLRPATVPMHSPRHGSGYREHIRSSDSFQTSPLKLKVTGSNLPVDRCKDPSVKPVPDTGTYGAVEDIKFQNTEPAGVQQSLSTSPSVIPQNSVKKVLSTVSVQDEQSTEAVYDVNSAISGLNVTEADEVSQTSETRKTECLLPVTVPLVSVILDKEVSLIISESPVRKVDESGEDNDSMRAEDDLHGVNDKDENKNRNDKDFDNVIHRDKALGKVDKVVYYKEVDEIVPSEDDEIFFLDNETVKITSHDSEDPDEDVLEESEEEIVIPDSHVRSEDSEEEIVIPDSHVRSKSKTEGYRSQSEDEIEISDSHVRNKSKVEGYRSQSEDITFFLTEEGVIASSTPEVVNKKETL